MCVCTSNNMCAAKFFFNGEEPRPTMQQLDKLGLPLLFSRPNTLHTEDEAAASQFD